MLHKISYLLLVDVSQMVMIERDRNKAVSKVNVLCMGLHVYAIVPVLLTGAV